MWGDLCKELLAQIIGKCGPAEKYSFRLTDRACRDLAGPCGKLDTIASMILYARKRKNTMVALRLHMPWVNDNREYTYSIFPRTGNRYQVKKVEPSRERSWDFTRSSHDGLLLSDVLDLMIADIDLLQEGGFYQLRFNPNRPDYPMTTTIGKRRSTVSFKEGQ